MDGNLHGRSASKLGSGLDHPRTRSCSRGSDEVLSSILDTRQPPQVRALQDIVASQCTSLLASASQKVETKTVWQLSSTSAAIAVRYSRDSGNEQELKKLLTLVMLLDI